MLKSICVSIVLLSACTPAFAQLNADEQKFGAWRCEAEPIVSFWEEGITGQAASGRSTLCRSQRGLWADMRLEGLTPDFAYTVWWVYVDNPAACVNFPLTTENAEIPFDEPTGYASPCGLADFFTPDASGEFLNPLVVFGRMDGAIANRKQTDFGGGWRDFEPSEGSQIWMFVFGHGPADREDKRQLARQLLTPEDPLSGAPHLGIEGSPRGYPAAVSVFTLP